MRRFERADLATDTRYARRTALIDRQHGAGFIDAACAEVMSIASLPGSSAWVSVRSAVVLQRTDGFRATKTLEALSLPVKLQFAASPKKC